MVNGKVQVVDDDAIVLASCQRVLEAEGFGVIASSSSEEALVAMEKDDIRLCLVDVKMPGHDGMWLIKKIKEKWPHMPVVVMSGYPTPETIVEGIESGAAEFLAKPFTPDEFLTSIRKVLERGGKDESASD